VQVGLLHDVLDLRLVAEHAAHRPVEPGVVAPHQHLEERGVPGADAGDDLLVGRVGLGAKPWGWGLHTHLGRGCAAEVTGVTSAGRPASAAAAPHRA
jgi:hypothetical protein